MAYISLPDLDNFASVLKSSDTTALSPSLTLAQEGRITVQWAPFDHTPSTARLVLVGITPGLAQARNGLRAFRDALKRDLPLPDALRQAKLAGSFSGPMRANLVAMLDHIGAQRALAVPSCEVLFDRAHELVHFTSALRYPTFIDGANYNGNPDMLRHPVLRQMVETFLAAEARALPKALWLPLGPKPTAALRHLVALGALPAAQVLEGMPHPSGANAERISFFLGRKDRATLSAKTRPDVLERARDALVAQVAHLSLA